MSRIKEKKELTMRKRTFRDISTKTTRLIQIYIQSEAEI